MSRREPQGRSAPVVTVIMPLYQTAEFVGEALDSVTAQSFEDLEVVVVDDGSTDGGLEIARRRAALDHRVTVICQGHEGAGAARNTGLAAAAGTYVAFLDADDLWLPNKLELQHPLLRPGVVVHSDAFLIQEGGRIEEARYHDLNPVMLDAAPLDAMLARNQIALLTAVVPRRTLLDHGGFDSLASPCEDYDLWLRLALAGVEFRYVDESLAAYRTRGWSNSSDPIRNNTARIRMFEKLEPQVPAGRRRAARSRIAGERQLLSAELMLRGWAAAADSDPVRARSELGSAIRAAPRWWRPRVVALALRLPVWRWVAPLVPRRDG